MGKTAFALIWVEPGKFGTASERPSMTSIMIYLHGVLVLICFTLHYPAPLSNSEPSDQEKINSAPPRISSTIRCLCRFFFKFICGSCNNVISFMIGRIILNYSNKQTKISSKWYYYWTYWFNTEYIFAKQYQC